MGSGPGFATGVAIDASNNVGIVASGPLDFGQGMSTVPGKGSIALLATDGSVQWARPIEAEPYAVTMDPAGDMIIVGAEHYGITIDLGGGALPMIGVDDAILLKVDHSGNHVWSRRIGDPQWGVMCLSVGTDDQGNTITAGVCGPAADFGAGPMMSTARHQFFVVKYDPDGNLLWQKRFGEIENYMQVASNAQGEVAISMELYKSVDLDGVTLTSTGISDIAIAKFDAAGTLQWTRQFGSPGIDYPTNIAIDNAGRVAFIGKTRTGVDFGGGLVSDAFLTVLDANGGYLWGKGFMAQPRAVAFDPTGNVVMTGNCGQGADFGGGALPGLLYGDGIFAARFDSQGDHLWSSRFGGPGPQDIGFTVAADPAGGFVLAGAYQGAADFGGGMLPVTTDDEDIFVAKFGEAAPATVSIDHFDATLSPDGVDITWDISGADKFTLLRRQDDMTQFVTIADGASSQKSYKDSSVQPGHSYDYQLIVQGADRRDHESTIASVSLPAPKSAVFVTSLGPNAPNPFNPTTSIAYTIGQRMPVTIDIFDVSGRIVTQLREGTREPGQYRAEWDGRGASGSAVASGIYFYRIAGNGAAGTRKMVLLK
jgi:hypothetical protein